MIYLDISWHNIRLVKKHLQDVKAPLPWISLFRIWKHFVMLIVVVGFLWQIRYAKLWSGFEKKTPTPTEVWAMPALETRWSHSCPQWPLTADLGSFEAASRPASRGKFVDGLAPSTSTVNRKVEKLEVGRGCCFLSMLQPKQKNLCRHVCMEVWWCMHISS